MKRITIFYFSGTGNTRWISMKLSDHLNGQGILAKAFSIEKIDPNEAGVLINSSDMVGFGYPVYGSDLPQIMKDFIDRLKPVEKKESFVYCTQWMWSGDGARVSAPLLSAKGFHVKWAEHFLMPNNVCVSIIPLLPYTNDKGKIRKILNRAEHKVLKFARRIVSGRFFLRGFNILAQISGNLQRVPFRRVFPKLRDDIMIDKKNCINCRLCLEHCPVGNIFLAGGEYKTRGNCIICFRCYNFCPVSAVMYMKKSHNKKRGEPYRGPLGRF